MLIFEEQWFPQLFRSCHNVGLDWTRMAAIIYIKSDGNIQKRVIDWNFIAEKLGPDNPTMLGFYDKYTDPQIEIIDRGTQWGLFQVYGEDIRNLGYTKHLLGLASTGAGIKYPIQLLTEKIEEISKYIEKLEKESDIIAAQKIKDLLPGIAEQQVFNIDVKEVDRISNNIKEECKHIATLNIE